MIKVAVPSGLYVSQGTHIRSPVMSGTLSTVAVTSRAAYRIPSTGTSFSLWPTIQQPTSSSKSSICSDTCSVTSEEGPSHWPWPLTQPKFKTWPESVNNLSLMTDLPKVLISYNTLMISSSSVFSTHSPVMILIKVLLMTPAYLQSITFREVSMLTSDPDK